jgi:hypothetical protein
LRAVRAAAEIRERLPAVADEVGVALRFRTGVNTGPVLMGEGENIAIGDAVNVAARLEQAAAPGEIVLGEETLRLVRDAVEVERLEPLELKGKSEPVPAFRLLSVDPEAAGFARHLDLPLIGRVDELRMLREAWERVVRESGCHLFTVLGAAGVGKSRLVAELLASVGDEATVLRGRCLHYGEGITFWPLVEMLTPVGDRAQQLLEHLTIGGAATPEELFWEVRRLLESLAAERPLIMHIDDLQWAEPMLLDLIDHIADLSRGVPILLVGTARPELLDGSPTWAGGKLNATTVLLEPLGPTESEALLDQLADGLDVDSRVRVIAASQGNPLFLEEMAALVSERGTVEVPPTIQALLAARLELLAAEERELLERGAVEGEVFHRLAVRALSGELGAAEVELRLAGLVRKELIRPHAATLVADEAFRFRHLLIRDAAYNGLPKATRAELHERFARWLEDSASGLAELDEIAGWRLEQAVRYLRELGREPDASLARSAGEHLHAAGRQAGRRGDTPAARNLLERALALADGTLHAQVAVDLADQMIEAGDMTHLDEVLAEAEEEPTIAAAAALARLEWLARTRPSEAIAAIESRLPGLIDEMTGSGDSRSLARAHMVAWVAHWLACQATPAARELRLAADHARRAGDEGLRARALAHYVAALVYGPTHADAMAAELEQLERESQGAFLQGSLDFGRSEVERLDGRLAEAGRSAQRAIDTLGALRNTMQIRGYNQLAAVELSAGDRTAALAALERSDAIAQEFGERSMRATTQARIAEVQALLGNYDAARAAIEQSDELSAPEDVINFAITHRLRAQLALIDGDRGEAERWARSAVRHAFLTDFASFRATSKLEVALVLQALERRDEAEIEAREALAISDAKGDRAAVARAQHVLDELQTAHL